MSGEGQGKPTSATLPGDGSDPPVQRGRLSWLERHPVVGSLGGVVVGAVLVGVLNYVTTQQTIEANAEQARVQIEAEVDRQAAQLAADEQGLAAEIEAARRDRDLGRRESVYSNFSRVGIDYQYAAQDFRKCVLREGGDPGGISQSCVDSANSYLRIGNRMQRAINRIHIYGTPQALRAMKRVAGALPSTLGGASIAELLEDGVQLRRFRVGLEMFFDVMCDELRYATQEPSSCGLT